MISDSQGGNPAFLQMNQNGRTPTTATITVTIKIITNSGIPIGPITFFSFGLVLNSCGTVLLNNTLYLSDKYSVLYHTDIYNLEERSSE